MALSADWTGKVFMLEPGDHELIGDTGNMFQPTQLIN